MSRRGLALLAAAVAAAALAPAGQPAPKVTTLKLVEVVTLQKLVVDNAPTQRSAEQPLSTGDVILARAKLLSAGKVVGSAEFFGVVTAFPRLAFYGTFVLPGGKVSVVDVGSASAPDQTFAVVGGTGRYAGARGTDRELRLGEGKNSIELRLAF